MQARLAVDVQTPGLGEQRFHAGLEFFENVARIRAGDRRLAAANPAGPAVVAAAKAGSGHAADHAVAIPALAVHARQPGAARAGAPRGDVVDVEEARLHLLAAHTQDVVVERGHEPVRLEDEAQRLPQRDVLQVAGERALDIGVEHHAQVRVPHEQQQELADGDRLGEAEGERLAHRLRPAALFNLADGERGQARLLRRLAGQCWGHRRRAAPRPARSPSPAPRTASPSSAGGRQSVRLSPSSSAVGLHVALRAIGTDSCPAGPLAFWSDCRSIFFETLGLRRFLPAIASGVRLLPWT